MSCPIVLYCFVNFLKCRSRLSIGSRWLTPTFSIAPGKANKTFSISTALFIVFWLLSRIIELNIFLHDTRLQHNCHVLLSRKTGKHRMKSQTSISIQFPPSTRAKHKDSTQGQMLFCHCFLKTVDFLKSHNTQTGKAIQTRLSNMHPASNNVGGRILASFDHYVG